jgi:hypothetical protein
MAALAKTVVVVSRYWHQPEIVVGIDHQQIRLELSVEDFCKALVRTIRHPAMLATRSGLEEQLLAATKEVLEQVKEASVHSPLPALPEA